MANFFRRKKNQPSPYDSVWDPNTNSWQAPVGSGQGLPAGSHSDAAAAATQNAESTITAQTPLSYGAFPAAPQAYSPPEIPGSSYGGLPVAPANPAEPVSSSISYGGFPSNPGSTYAAFPTTPSYGAFPDPQPYAGGGTTPTSYDGFPGVPNSSYLGFPPSGSGDPSGPPTPTYSAFPVSGQLDPAIQTAMNQQTTYSAFPTTPSYGAFPEPQPYAGGGTTPTSYDGFPTTPTYGGFPNTGGLDPAIQTAMNQQTTYSSFPAGDPTSTTGAQPDTSVLNPPSYATAQAKSEDMMSTAPASPAVPSDVSVSYSQMAVNGGGIAPEPTVPVDASSPLPPSSISSPPPEMTSADAKTEATAPVIPADQVGSVAAGTSTSTSIPVSYDVGGTTVTPPITLPPSTPSDTPSTGLGSLNASGVADTTSSNVHTPGMQE